MRAARVAKRLYGAPGALGKLRYYSYRLPDLVFCRSSNVATAIPHFAAYGFHPIAAWLGLFFAIAALGMFQLTHRALGRNWSVSLDVRESHQLVTDGIYRKIRHPMYSAFWLWAIAQALLLPNWAAGFAGLVGFGTLYFGRVAREERMMLQTFGDSYREYMARTGRVFPWIL